MKNVIELIHQTTGVKISFCYGAKAYSKYLKARFKLNEEIEWCGCSLEITKNNEYAIIIGVRKYKDIYGLKALIVHEISHAVSQLMEYHNFTCDELRSYTLQWLYQEIMPFLDEILQNKRLKKS